MSEFTPKTFNHPGIAEPLREQTLAEFVLVLDENHLVRRELRELQRRSAQAAQLSAEIQELSQRLRELEGRAGVPMPTLTATAPAKEVGMVGLTKEPAERMPCQYCGKLYYTSTGAWKSHMGRKHMDKPYLGPYDKRS